jgi:CheY-like chemotaxis protein
MTKKILLVEDYPANILVMTTLLEQLGHDCDVAQTGEEAVKKVQVAEYSLLFMDLNLPKLDGYGACAEIRKLEERRNRPATPIIGLTADVNEKARERCHQVGMNSVMPKTLCVDELAQMIERFAA